MIIKERFLQLWKVLVEDRADISDADASPLELSNGVSEHLRDDLLSNSDGEGECLAMRIDDTWY